MEAGVWFHLPETLCLASNCRMAWTCWGGGVKSILYALSQANMEVRKNLSNRLCCTRPVCWWEYRSISRNPCSNWCPGTSQGDPYNLNLNLLVTVLTRRCEISQTLHMLSGFPNATGFISFPSLVRLPWFLEGGRKHDFLQIVHRLSHDTHTQGRHEL